MLRHQQRRICSLLEGKSRNVLRLAHTTSCCAAVKGCSSCLTASLGRGRGWLEGPGWLRWRGARVPWSTHHLCDPRLLKPHLPVVFLLPPSTSRGWNAREGNASERKGKHRRRVMTIMKSERERMGSDERKRKKNAKRPVRERPTGARAGGRRGAR